MKTRTVLGLVLMVPAALGDSFTPNKVSLEELNNPTPTSLSILKEGLTDVGLISVTEISGFAQLRQDILSAASSCVVHAQPVVEKGFNVNLKDGTTRYTLAAETNGNSIGEIEGADFTHTACERFNELNVEFRELVAQVTERFASNVDEIIGAKRLGRKLMLDTETNKHLGSVSEIVQEGIKLEHFHTYEKSPASHSSKDFSVDMHIDQGLFIALTPAMNLNADASEDHGFYIKLSNGDVVQPHFGDGNNELGFMLGDGFTQWVTPKVDVSFRATPHAVVVPDASSGSALRSWYGRMVLPKASAFLEQQQMTFGEFRKAMVEEGNDANLISACSSDMVVNERTLQECGEGQIFCWMRCQDVTCGSANDAQCMKSSGSGFIECDLSVHDPGCSPVCI